MHHEYISSLSGRVYLVGAGPGDPGLITVKGLAALRNADVVVYDYLANPALLQEVKESTQKRWLSMVFAGRSFLESLLLSPCLHMRVFLLRTVNIPRCLRSLQETR